MTAGTGKERRHAPARMDAAGTEPLPCGAGGVQAATGDLRTLAVLFRQAAAGRREYAHNAPPHAAEILEVEACTLDAAARLADGDMGPMYSWLPSWRWTEDMDEMARRGNRKTGPELGKLTDMELGSRE